MFPNDEICNVKAAKNAARRIFQRYKTPSSQQTQSKGLGQSQVSGLIKNAYSAINMAYDPSISDVSSFMSVFGVGQNGTIELDKLEQLAVKYLCGQDTLKVQFNPESKENYAKGEEKQQLEISTENKHKKVNIQSYLNHSKSQLIKDKQIMHLQQISQQNTKNLSLKFLSPRISRSGNFFSSKQNIVNSSKIPKKEEGKISKKSTYSEILNQANQIFNQHKNKDKSGITVKQAGQVLMRTYQLIGKSKFMPSENDIRIWMKLCDLNKNGIVEWASYQNFVKRMMERQNITEKGEN